MVHILANCAPSFTWKFWKRKAMVRLGIGNLKEKLEEGTQLAKLYTVNSASVIHGEFWLQISTYIGQITEL